MIEETIHRLPTLRRARSPRSAVAVVSGEEAISYEDLSERVSRGEEALAAAGYGAGHRIAVRLPTGPGALVALLAAVRRGLTVTLISPALGTLAVEERMRVFRPHVVVEGAFDRLSPTTAAPGEAVRRIVLWTSGSNGVPKAVAFGLRQLLWNCRANARALGLRSDDRTLVLLDGAYCYALVHQIFSHLWAGATVVVPPQPLHVERVPALIERWGITTLAVVPSMLQSLLRVTTIRNQLGRVRLLTVGGARAPEPLLLAASEAVGGRVAVTYGLTEAGPRVCTRFFVPGDASAEHTVGTPLPGVEVRVDRDGELLVRSPSGRVGYLEDGRVLAADPWIRTGDQGAVDEHGNVTIHGRCAPMINRGGVKIAPAEIERALCSDPRVVAARVVACPHPRVGQVPKAYVVARAPAPSPAELAARCLELLGRPWVPVEIDLVRELPSRRSWKDCA